MTVTHPLRLATGSHQAGSGKGCAMNVVSYENGDSTITDFPDCSHPFLARIVQRVNDTICNERDGDLLCPECSMTVLALSHRTVGTSGADPDGRIMVRIAVEEAQRVAHLTDDPRAQRAIDAALAWVENPTAAAYAVAAAAANANAYAVAAAYGVAAYAAAAANANANAAANANANAYAVAAAAANANAVAYAVAANADRVISRFRELTGLFDETAPDPQTTAQAITRMLEVSA